MKKILSFIFILICACFVTHAFDQSAWPYYKEISYDSAGKPLEVQLDKEVLDYMNNDASDLRIVADNQDVPYVVKLTQPTDYAHGADVIFASSTRKPYRDLDFAKENMIDGRYDAAAGSTWEIDSTKDQSSAYFVVDIGSNSLSSSITIWSQNPQYTWTSIKIEGSYDNKEWNLIKAQTPYHKSSVRTVFYSPVDYRYLRFTLTHTQSLSISEIEIKGTSTGKLYFLAEENKDYRIYYGNRLTKKIAYNTSELYFERDLPIATLSKHTRNKKFDNDPDNDAVIYDNCPLIANPDQKDDDRDGLGNSCDNCPAVANAAQQDSDGDLLGNSCDNCPHEPNPSQRDEDFNGRGDACDDRDRDGTINPEDNCPNDRNPSQSDLDNDGIGDECDPKDDRLTENKLLLWSIFTITILVVGFLVVNLIRKTK